MSDWRAQYDTFDPPKANDVLEVPTPNSRYYVLAAILLWRLPQAAPLGPDCLKYPEGFTGQEDRRLYAKVHNMLSLSEWDALPAEERVPFMEEVAKTSGGVMDQVVFMAKESRDRLGSD